MTKARKSLVPILIFLTGLLTVTMVAWLYGLQYPLSVHSVFEDVVTYGSLAPMVGFMSDMGIVLWFTCAALFALGLHQGLVRDPVLSPSAVRFYLCAILLFVLMGLDDRLLIHEHLTAKYGIAEVFIVGAYALAFLAWAAVYRSVLLRIGLHWLIVAAISFCISIVTDLGWMNSILAGWSPSDTMVLEESAKWTGIVALFIHVFLLMEDAPRDV